MRILLIGAVSAEDSMEEHVEQALREMGHQVFYFDGRTLVDWNDRADNFLRMVARNILREPERLLEHKLLRCAAAFQPELVLVILGNQLSPKTVEKLKTTAACPVVCWCQDQLSTLGRQYVLGAAYDLVFFKDRYLVDLFKSMLDERRFHYLPEACNPQVHFHQPPGDDESLYKSEIATAATLYYYRQEILQHLLRYDLKVWGNVPDWLINRLDGKVNHRQVRGEAKRKMFGGAKIVLNTLHLAEVGGVNCRTFEAAACGAFQLVTHNDYVKEYFLPGEEIETFVNKRELLDKVEYYLANPDRRRAIAAKGMRRAHAEHTYQDRLAKIMELI